MEPILLKKEQEREERNKCILNDYNSLIKDFPGTRRWRIVRTLAEKYGISPEQIRYILIQKGAYIYAKPVEQD